MPIPEAPVHDAQDIPKQERFKWIFLSQTENRYKAEQSRDSS